MMLQTTSAFARLYALGYTRIVPVIPPDAEISENSTLHKRVGTRQDARGKLPGVKGRNGLWHSWDWTQHTTDPEDFTRWDSMGAGVGIITGDGLLAIDADTTDEALAKVIRDTIKEHLGQTPIRVGRYPKALYLIRVTDPYAYRRIDFGEPDEHGNQERVELLSDRKFFVAEGIHPKTLKPYTWPKDLVPYDDLPLFRPDQIDALMDDLKAKLPKASKVQIEGGGDAPINQAALKGDLPTVTKAVRATPNRSADFPTREAYRDFGYAIKAALPDHPGDAKSLFEEWCDRWEDGTNEPGVIDADWRRMKPPFRRGAGWLYETAERVSGGRFSAVEAHFEPVEIKEPSPFDVQAQHEAQAEEDDTFPVLSLQDIENRPPPAFLIDRHIPQVSTGFLYSAPGIGKSFLALDMALSLAFGDSVWHGDPIDRGAGEPCVLYLAAEGSFGFRNRVRAWRSARNIAADAPNAFVMIERSIDFMKATDVDKLIRTVRRAIQRRPCLIVVDTVSRSMPGADENLQKEMTLFVKACDHVKDVFQCAVLGVHHAGKSGDMRGSTVLRGAGDFVFKLERAKGASIGHLTCEKQKDAPDGWKEPYAFEKVDLADGQTSLVASRAALPGGRSGPMTPSSASLVLAGMKAAWDAGEPWGKTRRAGVNYAADRMVREYGLTAEQADSYLDLWVADGTIRLAEVSRKTKRVGYEVLRPVREGEGLGEHFSPVEGEAYDEHTNEESVFD
jgi:hypothetical protein